MIGLAPLALYHELRIGDVVRVSHRGSEWNRRIGRVVEVSSSSILPVNVLFDGDVAPWCFAHSELEVNP